MGTVLIVCKMVTVRKLHNPIIVGRDKDNYCGARAIIGGSNNNNLLFITYFPRNISVFDLNAFQFINHDYFQINNVISVHCFVSKSENDEEMIGRNDENIIVQTHTKTKVRVWDISQLVIIFF
ncbi:hypothetical protein RFI_36365 [Reticulomyxa filosa]|uniref:Uncharacterized protein n=1 Tax=Reticulomyxa filosa TaxID=46433 RepID=X6LIU9_RETFI|nr:hypothetical protein RFI_36365 [Reticulomyxa filosa]|eukprot:ETO01077.1 hypothetical protein RFI_36365 [Reticulomyxa filosa]